MSWLGNVIEEAGRAAASVRGMVSDTARDTEVLARIAAKTAHEAEAGLVARVSGVVNDRVPTIIGKLSSAALDKLPNDAPLAMRYALGPLLSEGNVRGMLLKVLLVWPDDKAKREFVGRMFDEYSEEEIRTMLTDIFEHLNEDDRMSVAGKLLDLYTFDFEKEWNATATFRAEFNDWYKTQLRDRGISDEEGQIPEKNYAKFECFLVELQLAARFGRVPEGSWDVRDPMRATLVPVGPDHPFHGRIDCDVENLRDDVNNPNDLFFRKFTHIFTRDNLFKHAFVDKDVDAQLKQLTYEFGWIIQAFGLPETIRSIPNADLLNEVVYIQLNEQSKEEGLENSLYYRAYNRHMTRMKNDPKYLPDLPRAESLMSEVPSLSILDADQRDLNGRSRYGDLNAHTDARRAIVKAFQEFSPKDMPKMQVMGTGAYAREQWFGAYIKKTLRTLIRHNFFDTTPEQPNPIINLPLDTDYNPVALKEDGTPVNPDNVVYFQQVALEPAYVERLSELDPNDEQAMDALKGKVIPLAFNNAFERDEIDERAGIWPQFIDLTRMRSFNPAERGAGRNAASYDLARLMLDIMTANYDALDHNASLELRKGEYHGIEDPWAGKRELLPMVKMLDIAENIVSHGYSKAGDDLQNAFIILGHWMVENIRKQNGTLTSDDVNQVNQVLYAFHMNLYNSTVLHVDDPRVIEDRMVRDENGKPMLNVDGNPILLGFPTRYSIGKVNDKIMLTFCATPPELQPEQGYRNPVEAMVNRVVSAPDSWAPQQVDDPYGFMGTEFNRATGKPVPLPDDMNHLPGFTMHAMHNNPNAARAVQSINQCHLDGMRCMTSVAIRKAVADDNGVMVPEGEYMYYAQGVKDARLAFKGLNVLPDGPGATGGRLMAAMNPEYPMPINGSGEVGNPAHDRVVPDHAIAQQADRPDQKDRLVQFHIGNENGLAVLHVYANALFQQEIETALRTVVVDKESDQAGQSPVPLDVEATRIPLPPEPNGSIAKQDGVSATRETLTRAEFREKHHAQRGDTRQRLLTEGGEYMRGNAVTYMRYPLNAAYSVLLDETNAGFIKDVIAKAVSQPPQKVAYAARLDELGGDYSRGTIMQRAIQVNGVQLQVGVTIRTLITQLTGLNGGSEHQHNFDDAEVKALLEKFYDTAINVLTTTFIGTGQLQLKGEGAETAKVIIKALKDEKDSNIGSWLGLLTSEKIQPESAVDGVKDVIAGKFAEIEQQLRDTKNPANAL